MLAKKFWEQPTKIKDGYLNSKEETKAASPKTMEIRNGKVIGWR